MSTQTTLKDEGNALFGFKGALAKYTEAIDIIVGAEGSDKEDETLAVLYANRAACYLNLKKYSDASTDAKKATKLNPGYSKAWGRLATAQTALDEFSESIKSWEQAICTLKAKDDKILSPAEIKQLKQYEDGLKASKDGLKAMEVQLSLIQMKLSPGLMPWERAEAMKPELERKGMEGAASSAWVIWAAYHDFTEGVKIMKALKKVQTPQGMGYVGMTSVVSSLSNGIMRDSRVFHIDDSKWVEYFNNQMMFEAQRFNAWTDGDAQTIIKEAKKRLRQQGWDSVRPALSTTLRGYILRGFMESGLKGNNTLSVDFIGRVIEILEWGRQEWAGVSKEQRGTIFEDTFIRGVHCLYIECLMRAFTDGVKNWTREESVRKLEELLKEADDILLDVQNRPLRKDVSCDPGFVSSFYIYPRGQALSMKGLYYRQMASFGMPRTAENVQDCFRKSAQSYLEAANVYPEDDEQHAWFLNCALENFLYCGTPIKVTLPLMTRIRLAIPQMNKIWEHSTMSKQGRDQILQKVLWMEEDLLKDIEQGKYTLEDQVMPELPA